MNDSGQRQGLAYRAFVDTDALPALDSRVGDLVQNEVEASLVQQLTLALLNGGVREEQIGIISLYRQQIKLLSHLLQDHKGIEILTADRSQGRDKDCIIISLVRANQENQVSGAVSYPFLSISLILLYVE